MEKAIEHELATQLCKGIVGVPIVLTIHHCCPLRLQGDIATPQGSRIGVPLKIL